jgi:hypothetical protein
MRSLHPFQIACLCGLLSLLSACDKKTETQEKKVPSQTGLSRTLNLDFNLPIDLEFKLVTKDMATATKLCKLEGHHVYECNVTVSGQSNTVQHGEVSVKTKAVFSQKELDTLIASVKQKYHTEGAFSYSISQKKKFEFSPQ